MDVPWPSAIVLKPMIFVIEVLGLCIKHFVLAMRLLANMMAGHVVLAVLGRLHCRGGKISWLALYRDRTGECSGSGRNQLTRIVCGFLTSLHFCVFGWTVYRDGGPSPLTSTNRLLAYTPTSFQWRLMTCSSG